MKILKYSLKFALFHVKPHRKIRTVVLEKCNSHSVSRSLHFENKICFKFAGEFSEYIHYWIWSLQTIWFAHHCLGSNNFMEDVHVTFREMDITKKWNWTNIEYSCQWWSLKFLIQHMKTVWSKQAASEKGLRIYTICFGGSSAFFCKQHGCLK